MIIADLHRHSPKLEGGEIALGYLDQLIFMARYRVPFEDWPKELQDISGVNKEFLGPVTTNQSINR